MAIVRLDRHRSPRQISPILGLPSLLSFSVYLFILLSLNVV